MTSSHSKAYQQQLTALTSKAEAKRRQKDRAAAAAEAAKTTAAGSGEGSGGGEGDNGGGGVGGGAPDGKEGGGATKKVAKKSAKRKQPSVFKEDLLFHCSTVADNGAHTADILKIVSQGFSVENANSAIPFASYLHIAEYFRKAPRPAAGSAEPWRARFLVARVAMPNKPGNTNGSTEPSPGDGGEGAAVAPVALAPEHNVENPALALPEFIIDLEFISTKSPEPPAPPSPLVASSALASTVDAPAPRGDGNGSVEDGDGDGDGDNKGGGDSDNDGEPTAGDDYDCVGSHALYLSVGSSHSLKGITTLDLSRQFLGLAPGLQQLVGLKVLSLHGNRLTHLSDCAGIPTLESLDVSENAITHLTGLWGLPNLKVLDMRHNQLRSPADLLHIADRAPLIETLDLRGNPVFVDRKTHSNMIQSLQHLRSVSGIPLDLGGEARTVAGIQVALGAAGAADMDQVLEGASTSRAHPRMTHNGWASDFLLQERRRGVAGTVQRPAQIQGVTSISLPDMMYLELPSIAGATASLTWMNLAGNCLTAVPGIQGCTNLKELCLAGNLFSDVDDVIGGLYNLRRLDLSRNYISVLPDLSHLRQLEELAIESNAVRTLQAVGNVPSLKRLFASDNQIHAAWEVFHLRTLPELEVLDLDGNGLTSREDFRYFVVYHLDALAVLDGAVVDADLVKSAWQRFDSKLSIDLLVDLKGEANLQEMTQLELPGAGIRDILPLWSCQAMLAAVTSINLQDNRLSNFAALGDLPSLRSLCLNRNKVRRLESSKSTRSLSAPIFPELTVLHLGGNDIADLVPLQLARFPKLRSLFLQHNDLNSTAGICRLMKLEDLVLESNRIKDVTAETLTTCPKLRELHLQSNRLRSIGEVPRCKSLTRVYLHSNRITSLGEAEKLASLPSLTDVSLLPNPAIPSANTWGHRPLLLSLVRTMRLIDGTPPTEQDLYDARQLIEQREDAEVSQHAATAEQAYYRDASRAALQAGSGGGGDGRSSGGDRSRDSSAKGNRGLGGLVVGALALPKIGAASRNTRQNGARSRRV